MLITRIVALSMVLAGPISGPVVASEAIEWSYTGAHGPDHWHEINSGYGLCGRGTQQSPIDIVDAYDTYLEPPMLSWHADGWEAENNGRSLILYNPQGGTAMLDGAKYTLIQVNFHAHSEHTFSGEHFPMEVQFLHRDEDGNFMIVAQMLRGGGRHDEMNAILASMPMKKGQANQMADINLSALVADIGDAYRYQGSLTIPPCAETVTWIVLADPIIISDEALQAFTASFPKSHRPVQPLNRRIVLTD